MSLSRRTQADRQLKASEKALEEVAASWGGMSASQRRSAARGALDRAKERLLAVSDSLSCKSTAGKGPAAEGSGDKGGDPDGIAARVAALIERVEGLVAADEAEAKARETKRKAEVSSSQRQGQRKA